MAADQTIRFDLQSEKAVIGGCLKHGADAVALLRGILTEKSFYESKHSLLWKTMCSLLDAKKAIEPLTIDAEIACFGENRSTKTLIDVEDFMYFGPSKLDALEVLAKRIAGLFRDRTIELTAKQIIAKAHDKTVNSDELCEQSMSLMSEATRIEFGQSYSDGTEVAEEFVKDVELAQSGQLNFLKTGLDVIDVKVNGLVPSCLYILGARPAMGKSAFMLQIVDAYASQQAPVLLFSLEMPKKQLFKRMVCQRTRINGSLIKNGCLEDHQMQQLLKETQIISQLPILWDDKGNRTINEIRASAMRAKTENENLALIVIDYIQKLKVDGKRFGNREQEVNEIVSSLKDLSKELEVPVLGLSMVKREVESRPNKRPSQGDLRESGAIEAEADAIMLMYRDEVYTKEKCEKPGVCEFIIDKSRDGLPGTFEMGWEKETTRFYNLEIEQ